MPAYAGIPVTDRRLSSSVAIVTGHRGKDEHDHRIDWEGLARSAETLVILMGTAWLEDIVARIIAGGRDPATPAAAIARGSTPRQRVVVARLQDLPARVRAAGLAAPTVVVIGRVVEFREHAAWFEQLPLFGRRVLVARAAEQAAELALELRRRAAEPVRVPLLELVPTAQPERARGGARERVDYDWIVYTLGQRRALRAPRSRRARAHARRVHRRSDRARGARGRPARRLVPPGESTPEQLGRGARRGRARSRARACSCRARSARATRCSRALEALRRARRRGRGLPHAHARGRRRAARARSSRSVSTRSSLTSPSTVEHLFALLSPAERRRSAARAVLRLHRTDHGDGARRRAARSRGARVHGRAPDHDRARRCTRARALRRSAMAVS